MSPSAGADTLPPPCRGSRNQPTWPAYQIAVQSPCRPATAYCWPVTALALQSLITVVPGEPSGCRYGSLSSGALSDGWVRRYTKLVGCGGSDPARHPVQPVTGGWRSEERRVGKEGRGRGWPDDEARET